MVPPFPSVPPPYAEMQETFAAVSGYAPGSVVPNCSGGLILHIDGTRPGCTLDEEPDGCAGIELRHEGDPTDCVREWGGCNHCGVHER